MQNKEAYYLMTYVLAALQKMGPEDYWESSRLLRDVLDDQDERRKNEANIVRECK
jgi:hypothetical protein